jgi:transitional endoplasmic reticulum ATPase
MPDKDTRKQILQIHLKKKPLGADVNMDKLVDLTDRYTGAEIEALVNAAAIAAVRGYIIAKEQKPTKEEKDTTNIEHSSGIKEKYDNDKKEEEEQLEISMKHFESSLSKIAKKNNNPSLYKINSIA